MVDEVGYIPFEAEAANLFFQLVSSRHERACVVIVTSNKQFGKRTGSREGVQGGALRARVRQAPGLRCRRSLSTLSAR